MLDGYSNFPCLNHKNSIHSSHASSHGKFPWHACGSGLSQGVKTYTRETRGDLCAGIEHNPTRPNIRHPPIIRLCPCQNLRRRIPIAPTCLGEHDRTYTSDGRDCYIASGEVRPGWLGAPLDPSHSALNPKSVSLIHPFLVPSSTMIKLSGLMSRWTTPALWHASTPWTR